MSYRQKNKNTSLDPSESKNKFLYQFNTSSRLRSVASVVKNRFWFGAGNRIIYVLLRRCLTNY